MIDQKNLNLDAEDAEDLGEFIDHVARVADYWMVALWLFGERIHPGKGITPVRTTPITDEEKASYSNAARNLFLYAIAKRNAITLRLAGEITQAQTYETKCENIYKDQLPKWVRW